MKLLISRFMVAIVFVVVPIAASAHEPVSTLKFYDGEVRLNIANICGQALDDWINNNWTKPELFVWKVGEEFIPYNFYTAQKKLPEPLFPLEKATTIEFGLTNITAVPLGSKAFHRRDEHGSSQIDIACFIDVDNIEVMKIGRKWNYIEE